MVVRPREQFLGPITQLDKYQGGLINAHSSEIRNATLVLNSRLTAPTTGANTGSFWVLDTDPTTPKFTDSNGNTIDLCCGGGNVDADKVGSGTVTLINGTASVITDLPMDAVLTFSRKTPSGVLGEVYDAGEKYIIRGPGVEFPPGSGKYLSVSTNAQLKWMGWASIAYQWEAMGMSYPFTVRTIDDADFIYINNAEDVIGVFVVMAQFIAAVLNGSETVKAAIQAATTEEEMITATNTYLATVPAREGSE